MCGSGACVGLKSYSPQFEIVRPQGQAAGEMFVRLKPKGLVDKGLYYFQNVFRTEKVAQIANESFHLFHPLLKRAATPECYNFFNSLHEGAHALDDMLHSVTFAHDLLSMAKGEFANKGMIRTAARSFHFAAHLLATGSFLHQQKLVSRWNNRLALFGTALHALGYTISLAEIIWKRVHTGEPSNHMKKDLFLQGNGLLVEGIAIFKEMQLLGSWQTLFTQVRSVTIIAQSFFALYLLSGPERVRIPLGLRDRQA